MFLDYVALGLLIFVALVIFYGIIVIHDIPYEIAHKRNHSPGCYPRYGLDKPFHTACAVALPLDMGNFMA